MDPHEVFFKCNLIVNDSEKSSQTFKSLYWDAVHFRLVQMLNIHCLSGIFTWYVMSGHPHYHSDFTWGRILSEAVSSSGEVVPAWAYLLILHS